MVRPVVMVPVDDGEGPGAFGVIAAAAGLRDAEPPCAVLVGHAPSDSDIAAAFRHGAGEVVVCAHAAAAVPAHPDQVLAMLSALIGQEPRWPADAVFILPAGLVGEEVAARLAARFGGVALGRCQTVALDGGAGRRGAFGGRAELVVGGGGRPCFVALHGAEPPDGAAATGPIRRVDLDVPLPPGDQARRIPSSGGEARLDGARIVVAGGRGMGGEEGFAQLRELAVLLGGAVGGSLPTIDAGWMPVSRQIGQSGRFVVPDLYVAVAISGTPQHMAGIGVRSRIVAINRDPEADIFRHATIGVVADWKALLPALLTRLATAAT
jgi:electron transfer flavoprotein alpha subunit